MEYKAMIRSFKALASRLPLRYQQDLKRVHFRRQIASGHFSTDEPEFTLLDRWLTEGDIVLDIGANVGHYALKLSNLVGRTGRVVAFEPVRETFELLAANASRFPYDNVTLVNAAAAERTQIAGMTAPKFDTNLTNYYEATLNTSGGEFSVLCLTVDSLDLPSKVRLIKLDVEGHEISALKGAAKLLKRDRPILIVEGDSRDVADYLLRFGYKFEKLDGSPNRVYTCSV